MKRRAANRTVPRLVRLVFVPAVALCSATCGPSTDEAGSRGTTVALERIAREFGRLAQEGDGQAVPGAEAATAVLEDYFDAATRGDVPEAHRALFRLYTGLRGVSERRFRDLSLAFSVAAFEQDLGVPERERVEIDQVIAPVTFLFFELGGRAIDDRFRDWLIRQRPLLIRAMKNPGSRLSGIGLAAIRDAWLVKLPPDGAESILDSLDAGVWDSGKCVSLDLVAVDDGDALFCPDDCTAYLRALELLDPETRAAMRAMREEIDEICASMKEAIESTKRIRPALMDCVASFAAETPGGLACLIEKFAEKDPLERFALPGRYEYEVRVPRGCQLSTGGSNPDDPEDDFLDYMTEEERERYEELTDEYGDLSDEQRRLWWRFDQYAETLDRHEESLARCEANGTCGDWLIEAHERHRDGAADRLLDTADRIVRNGDRMHEIATEARELYDSANRRMQEDPRRRPGPRQRCAPDSPDCSDECGIRNELYEDTAECIQADRGEDLGDRSEPNPPDPWVSLPDPRDPDVPAAAVAALHECITQALRDSPPDGQHSCTAVLRCPFGVLPTGDYPDCKCDFGEQEPALPRPCETVIQCTPEMARCTCGVSPDGGASEGGDPFGPDPEVFGGIGVPLPR